MEERRGGPETGSLGTVDGVKVEAGSERGRVHPFGQCISRVSPNSAVLRSS